MKLFIVALLTLLAAPARAAYLDTIAADPLHPRMSTKVLVTPKFALDGGVADAALVYHVADPHDSLWPQSWIDAGVPALSWNLLETGVGGNSQSAFVHFGASVDAAPTLLSPLTIALRRGGGNYATFADLLVSPTGDGVGIGFGWKASILTNDGFTRLNDLRAPPRYSFDYHKKF